MLAVITCCDAVARRDLLPETCPSPAGRLCPRALVSVGEAGLMAMQRASAPGHPGGGRPCAAHD